MPEPLIKKYTDKWVRNIKRGEQYDVYVGRGSAFGNPYKVGRDGNREQVVYKYAGYLLGSPDLLNRVQTELTGKTLGCYCAPEMCHANILAFFANATEIDDAMEKAGEGQRKDE